MPGFNDGWLGVPARPGKPRQDGLTHVMDKGLNIRDIEGMFDTAGDFVDIVKLGWGTSYVTNNLEKKIALYRHFETPVVCGGTLFEAVYAKGKIDEFKAWLTEHRFAHVEISDGTIDIPRDEKLDLIRDFARDFTVLSEVGSKDSDVVFAPYQWVEWIKEELEAGSWKVITEAREGGTAGIFRKDGDMRTGLIDEIAHEVVDRRPHLRGADEVVAGVVREAVRPEREPRQHPARRGDPARDAASRPPRATRSRRSSSPEHGAGGLGHWCSGLEAVGRRSPDRPSRRDDRHGRRLADDADADPRLRLQADRGDRHRHPPRRHLQVVRRRAASSARARARTARDVDADRLGPRLAPRGGALVVPGAHLRRRLRERRPTDSRDHARDRRDRLLRQGVPAPSRERRAVHPRRAATG